MSIKLDLLAFGAHPDDVELSCSGTLMSHIFAGKKAGVVDLTTGQLGTRGTPELRLEEAEASARILGLEIRDNLGFEDGYFRNDPEHQLAIIRKIRQYRPEIVFANAPTDRHPDHGRAANLVSEACFYAGLMKIETEMNGEAQTPWRPKVVYHYIQYQILEPKLLVDISGFMDRKLDSILAFRSQFYNPSSTEPETLISSRSFLDYIKERNSVWGKIMGVDYAEGFMTDRPTGVRSLFDLV